MTEEEIVKQVKAIIVDKLGVEESEVTETANFTNDLGADSLDTVELLMEFERVFGIKIPDEETSTIATVKDAIDKVMEKLAGKEEASSLDIERFSLGPYGPRLFLFIKLLFFIFIL